MSIAVALAAPHELATRDTVVTTSTTVSLTDRLSLKHRDILTDINRVLLVATTSPTILRAEPVSPWTSAPALTS